MAKTFLTNINLKGNQLLNAVIHSASSAPSALAAGQLYFNTGDNTFYYSTGTGTGNWQPVGVQYISAVNSDFFTVTDGSLDFTTTPVFSRITTNDDGNGTNILVGNDAYIGDINVANFVGIRGFTDGTKGGIKFGSAKTEAISTDGNNLTLTANNDIVLLPGSNYAYIGTPLIDGSNRIATIGDINTDLTGYVTETGVETLTNKTIGDKLNFTGYTNPTDGYIWSNTSTGAIEVNAEYDIQLSPGGIVNIGSGYGELHLQKTEYWRNGTQQGIIAAQSDNSLRFTATDGQLQLESNDGDVRINPSSTVTWFNNNLNINGDGGVISTDNNSLHLNADNGVITTDTAEFHTTKTEYWHGGDTSGTRLGIIVAHPSDGSLSIAASNQLVLEAHSGDINLYPDGNAYIGFSIDGNRIATISDVHSVAQGLNVKNSVAVATTANITIVGAPLLLTTSIDGYTVQNGDRVLVKNQDDATTNGIYDFTVIGGYTRAADESTPAKGDFVFVENGTANGKTGWILSNTDSLDYTWTQFSAAGEYSFADGVYLDGNTVKVDYEGLESQLVTDGFVKTSDITTVTRKYALDITPATPFNTNTFTVTHNLDTVDVIARVYQTYGPDNGADVEVDIKRTSNNALTVSFATAPASGETYTVVVIG